MRSALTPARGMRAPCPGPAGQARRMAALLALLLAAILSLPGTKLAAQTVTERDLQALRFYIAEGDTRSIEAELRRLRLTFPDWVPPENLDDLATPAPSEEIDRIYRQIAAEDFAAARATIAETRATFPDWTPPSEMLRLLETAEAQVSFTRAVEAGEARAAIGILQSNRELLSCDRINNAWLLADMYLTLGDAANALTTYRGIVQTCRDVEVLVPTIEKADEIASLADLESLLSAARAALPEQAGTFTALETRLRAGRGLEPRAPLPGAEAATVAAIAAQAEGAAMAAQAEGAVEVRVFTPGDTLPQGLSRQRPAPRGEPIPRLSSAAATGAAATGAPAAGGAGPARAGGLPNTGDGRISSVRAAAARGAWTECLSLSAQPRSVDVLYERSWCAYNAKRPLEALSGFTVAAQSGLGAVVRRDARFGMMLAYLETGMTEDAARLAAVTDLTREQRIEVEARIIDQRAVRAYRLGDFASAIAHIDALERMTGVVRRDLALLRGYAFLNSGQRERARAEFERLHRGLATPETAAALDLVRE